MNPFFFTFFSTLNHKMLSLYYLYFSLLFLIVAYFLSVCLRIELYSSASVLLSFTNLNFYNLAFTVHALLMIFFFIMPVVFSFFGNFLLPLYFSISEVIFPRLNCFALLLFFLSFVVLVVSLLVEFGSTTGWTLYPPLSTSLMNLSSLSVNIVILSLLLSGVSSLLSSVNFTFTTSANSITLFSSMSFYVWSVVFTSFLLILTLPILTVALIFTLSDLLSNTSFYNYSGDAVFYQHLFWFFGHPEVYILILPSFGLISACITFCVAKSLFGNRSLILSMACIAILGCVVWGHHMYTVGMELDTRTYFTTLTIMISLPTGTKIYNWCTSFLGSTAASLTNIVVLFIFLFLFTFTLGGTTGVVLGNAIVDLALHDTYYVVAHFHLVLSLGALTSILTAFFGFYHFILPQYNAVYSSQAKAFFLLLTTSLMLIFMPMHFLGFNVLPRRIPYFPDSLISWNILASLGSAVSLFLFLLFIAFSTFSRTVIVVSSLINNSRLILLFVSVALCSLLSVTTVTIFLHLFLITWFTSILSMEYFPFSIYMLYSFILSEALVFITAFSSIFYYGSVTYSWEASTFLSPSLTFVGSLTLALPSVVFFFFSSFYPIVHLSAAMLVLFLSYQISEYVLFNFYYNGFIISTLILFITAVHFTHILFSLVLSLYSTFNSTVFFFSSNTVAICTSGCIGSMLLYFHFVELLWLFLNLFLYTLSPRRTKKTQHAHFFSSRSFTPFPNLFFFEDGGSAGRHPVVKTDFNTKRTSGART